MNQNEKSNTFQTDILPGTEFAEIEAELNRMAEDTPEMPETFHSAWTAAVRAEAQTAEKARKKTESRRQWRYILSAAAVFVFLISGTLLTRTNRNNAKNRVSSQPAVTFMQEAGEAWKASYTAGTNSAPEEDAAEAEEEEQGYMLAEDAGAVMDDGEEELIADGEMAIQDAYDAEEGEIVMDDYGTAPAYEEAAEEESVPMYAEAAEEAMVPAGTMAAEEAMGSLMFAADEAMKAVGDTAAENTPEPTPLLTGEPPQAEVTADEAEEESEGTANGETNEGTDEEAETEEGFAGFLKDLGSFTLKSLPWLLGAAALLAAVALIRRRTGKKR